MSEAPDYIDEDGNPLWDLNWGVFETETSVHIMPMQGDMGPAYGHEADATCFCEPVVDPESFQYPRCLYVHSSHPDTVDFEEEEALGLCLKELKAGENET